MHRSSWSRWIKTLNGRRGRQEKSAPRRLTVTNLESRDVPTGFTAGDLVVYRVGTGTALTASSAPVVLDQFTTAVGGATGVSVALPVATGGAAPTSHALTAFGTTVGDGLLSTTADGRYLIATGYNIAPGNTISTTASTVNRVIGLIDINGNVDTTTALTDANGNLRAAASLDGGAFWTAGGTSGNTGPVRLAAGGQTGTTVALSSAVNNTSSALTSAQGITIYNGQLYTDASVSVFNGLGAVGAGLPLTTGQLTSILPGFPGIEATNFSNPRQFVFANSTTVYVADSNPATNVYGGLQKWTLGGNGIWTQAYVIQMPVTTEGLVSVVADPANAGTFYAITTESTTTTPNKLVKIVDGGTAASSTVTVLDTAPTNELFRGVAFAPSAVGTTAVTNFGVVPSSNSVPLNTSVTFTATVTAGTTPTGYVTFENGSTVLAVVPVTPGVAGTATAGYTTSALAAGSNTITAVYGGDVAYLSTSASASAVTVAAGSTTTTGVISNTPLPTAGGQSVTFTATVTNTGGASAPTGSVSFYDDNVLLGTAPLGSPSGNTATAPLTVTTNTTAAAGKLVPGSHTITAIYNGAGFVTSTGTVVQNVKPNAYATGNIVIERIGDGTNPLTGATPDTVFLDERTTAGTLVQSIVMPTTLVGSNHALTIGGSIVGDGLLSDSVDGRYLLAVGYDVPLGTNIATTQPRVIGRIDSAGNVDTTTAVTDASASGTNNIRQAASDDGFGIWEVGGNASQNLRFTTFGTSGTSVGISSTFGGTSITSGLNAIAVNTNTGQLNISGGAANIDGVGSVGTSVSGTYPTTSNQTETLLNNFPGPNASGVVNPFPQVRQFINSPDGTTIFAADSRVVSSSGTFYGGLQIWNASSGIYGKAGGTNATNSAGVTVGNQPNFVVSPDGTNNDEGLVGLTADFSSYNATGDVTFYAVTSEIAPIPNKLVKIAYNNNTHVSSVTILATAPANETFSGVAMAPTPVGTASATVGVTSSAGPNALLNSLVTYTATVSGTPTPTGYVTFQKTLGGVTTTLAVVPIPAGSNQAVYNDNGAVTNALGTVTVTAFYGGDSTYATKAGTFAQQVVGSLTNTVVTSNFVQPTSSPSVPLVITATITGTGTGGNPTGSVNFFDNGLPILNGATVNVVAGAGNTATATVTINTGLTQSFSGGAVAVLTPGIHTITASYSASGSFGSSSNSAIQAVQAKAFGAGDVLVYRTGDGVNSLTVNGNTVYIDEYTTAANQSTPVQSIVMPTTSASALGAGGNQALISCSQQTPEGQLSLSSDGQYVYLTGYDAAPIGVVGYQNTDLHASAATTIPRTIGRIKYDGTIDTSMALTDLADGGSVRGVASPGGNQVYAAGTAGGATSNGGVRYVGTYASGTTTSIQIDSAANNTNGATGPLALSQLEIFGGQLYVTDSSNLNQVKVATVGTGIPTTTGQNDTILNGLPSGATTAADVNTNAPGFPVGAFFAKLQVGPSVGADTMYVTDDGPNFFGGTITKWAFASGTWTKVGTILSNGATANDAVPSFNALNGTISGTTVNLYTTYANGGSASGPGILYSIQDASGYGAAFSSTTPVHLASVGSAFYGDSTTNEYFRGVAPVPTTPLTVSSVVSSDGIAADGTTQRSEVRQIQVTFSGPVTFAGGNTNAAAAFQLQRVQNSANVALTAAVVTNATNTVVTLTFSGALADPLSVSGNAVPVPGPSLVDGNYQLTIFANAVSGTNGFALAGGGASGNYVSPTQTAFVAGQPNIYRIYGDATGNGVVDSSDLGNFRTTYNAPLGNASYLAYLDADNSGIVDSQDLGQFRTRYNNSAFAP